MSVSILWLKRKKLSLGSLSKKGGFVGRIASAGEMNTQIKEGQELGRSQRLSSQNLRNASLGCGYEFTWLQPSSLPG